MMYCPAHGEVLPCRQCLSNLQAKSGPPWCCEKGEALNVKVCRECAEASAGYLAAMNPCGVTLPLAPICKQAAGCPDPAWCARAGVCLNVPAKDGVTPSDGGQHG